MGCSALIQPKQIEIWGAIMTAIHSLGEVNPTEQTIAFDQPVQSEQPDIDFQAQAERLEEMTCPKKPRPNARSLPGWISSRQVLDHSEAIYSIHRESHDFIPVFSDEQQSRIDDILLGREYNANNTSTAYLNLTPMPRQRYYASLTLIDTTDPEKTLLHTEGIVGGKNRNALDDVVDLLALDSVEYSSFTPEVRPDESLEFFVGAPQLTREQGARLGFYLYQNGYVARTTVYARYRLKKGQGVIEFEIHGARPQEEEGHYGPGIGEIWSAPASGPNMVNEAISAIAEGNFTNEGYISDTNLRGKVTEITPYE